MDAGTFEFWQPNGEMPPTPPAGPDASGFELWRADGEMPSVISFGKTPAGSAGPGVTVIIGPYRRLWPRGMHG